jgi:hypothetical protein
VVKLPAEAVKAVAKEANVVSLLCQKKRERKQQVRADNNKILSEGDNSEPLILFLPSCVISDSPEM